MSKNKSAANHDNDDDDDGVIVLNVGGTLFSTMKSTLKKKIQDQDHYLKVLVQASTQFKVTKDTQGHVFIDRDPLCFAYILNFLRSGGKICHYMFPWHDIRLIVQIMEEAKYYNIHPLASYLRGAEWLRFDTNNCSSRIKLLEDDTVAQSLEDSLWGSVRAKYAFVQQNVTPSIAKHINFYEIQIAETNYTTNTCIFVGIVNASTVLNKSIGYKNSGYSFYCYNGQKYENDSAQVYSGGSVGKNDRIGLWFDICAKSLYFYRNGENLGCAFTNIDTALPWYFAVSLYLQGDAVKLNTDAKHPDIS